MGHSNVSGCYDYYMNKFDYVHPSVRDQYIAHDLYVDHNFKNVFLVGQSRATTKSIPVPYLFASHVYPDLVILELGSNDIVNGETPYIVAERIFAIGEKIHSLYGSLVGFISVLPRLGNLRKITPLDFNFAMTEVNNSLQMYAKRKYWSFYHKHKGFWEIEEEGNKRVRPINTWS